MKESTGQSIVKEELSRQLHSSGNAFSRYKNKVLGANKGIGSLILFELCQLLFCNLGGAPGYVLRKMAYKSLFRECAGGVIWGKGIVLRAPGNITIGERVAIDDLTQLDGGTAEACSTVIGKGSVICKGCVIQSKLGPLTMVQVI